jgi:hypothetical protein
MDLRWLIRPHPRINEFFNSSEFSLVFSENIAFKWVYRDEWDVDDSVKLSSGNKMMFFGKWLRAKLLIMVIRFYKIVGWWKGRNCFAYPKENCFKSKILLIWITCIFRDVVSNWFFLIINISYIW